jgi:hypothetical protein
MSEAALAFEEKRLSATTSVMPQLAAKTAAQKSALSVFAFIIPPRESTQPSFRPSHATQNENKSQISGYCQTRRGTPRWGIVLRIRRHGAKFAAFGTSRANDEWSSRIRR